MRRFTIGALVVSLTGLAACGTWSAAARKPWTPPSVTARVIGAQADTATPGTRVNPSAFKLAIRPPNTLPRVFDDARHGYALANIGPATYPARTVDAGKTWRVDGPALHVNGMQAGLGVGEIGVVDANVAYTWGGITPDNVVDVTMDGGKHWWRAFLPGLVLFVGHEGPAVVANIYGSLTQRHTTHTGLWVYETMNGRNWTYATTLH